MAPGDRPGRLTQHGDVPGLLRAQVQEVHRALDDGLSDWLASRQPGRQAPSSHVVALYVHAATVEDLTIHALLRQVAPVYETSWGGRGPARYSPGELAPVRAYAQQVFGATDTYLAALGLADARRTVDLSRLGQGHPTVAWVVSKFVVLQLAQIYGELTSAARHR